MKDKSSAGVFTVAILKGVVEGDPRKHFGSELAFKAHRAIAFEHGLIEWTDADEVTQKIQPTDKARELYVRHQLDRLPDGRVYMAWVDWIPLLDAVMDELNAELEP